MSGCRSEAPRVRPAAATLMRVELPSGRPEPALDDYVRRGMLRDRRVGGGPPPGADFPGHRPLPEAERRLERPIRARRAPGTLRRRTTARPDGMTDRDGGVPRSLRAPDGEPGCEAAAAAASSWFATSQDLERQAGRSRSCRPTAWSSTSRTSRACEAGVRLAAYRRRRHCREIVLNDLAKTEIGARRRRGRSSSMTSSTPVFPEVREACLEHLAAQRHRDFGGRGGPQQAGGDDHARKPPAAVRLPEATRPAPPRPWRPGAGAGRGRRCRSATKAWRSDSSAAEIVKRLSRTFARSGFGCTKVGSPARLRRLPARMTEIGRRRGRMTVDLPLERARLREAAQKALEPRGHGPPFTGSEPGGGARLHLAPAREIAQQGDRSTISMAASSARSSTARRPRPAPRRWSRA